MLNEAAFVDIEQAVEPLLLTEGADVEVNLLLESLDSAPYALEKKVVKGKGDISYIFADETGDRYRIQFLTGSKLGKGVAKVYVGKAKSEKLFVDKIDRFSNPRAMISTIISLFTEHLLTPEGMGLRGFVVDLSGAASVRAIPLMKKVINSTLRSKVKVVDGTYDPVPNRKYIWVTKATLKPAEVFDGEGVGSDAPWLQGVERKGSQATIAGKDGKAVPFDPMAALQLLANEVTAKLKGKYPKIEIRPSYNAQGKVGMLTPYIQGAPVGQSAVYALATLKAGPDSAAEAKVVTGNIQAADDLKAKKLAEIQEEKKRQNKLATDPLFYLNQMKPELEKQINRVYPNLNVSVSFKDPSVQYNLAKVVLSIDSTKVGDASVLLFGEEPAKAMESIRASIKKEDWTRATKEVEASKVKSTTQTADGKVAKTLDANAKKMIDLGMKDVKSLVDGRVEFKHPEFGDLTATFSNGLISQIMGSGGVDRIAQNVANLFAENLKKPAMLYMGNAVPSPVRAKAIEKALATRVGVLKQRVSSVVILPPSITIKQGGVTYELKARTQSGGTGATVVTLNPIDGGTSVVGDTTNNGKTEQIQKPLAGLIIPVEAAVEEFSKFRDIVNDLERGVAPPTSAKAIVRAKYKDPHGYYIIVSYNPNINRVFVKDDGGTSYAASRVMFMHPNKGTAELNSMFTDAVLSGEPSNSTELVKILSKITKLPRWETA